MLLIHLVCHDLSVSERYHAMGISRGQVALVSNKEYSHLQRFVQAPDQLHHLGSGLAVKIAGWLVGEQDGGFIDQRTRERNALLLASGKLCRTMPGAVREAYPIKGCGNSPLAIGAIHLGKAQREFNVLKD